MENYTILDLVVRPWSNVNLSQMSTKPSNFKDKLVGTQYFCWMKYKHEFAYEELSLS